MREIKFRAWNGTKMIYNVTPFQWDFVLTTMAHKCIDSNGVGMLGSGGTEAKFEVTGYAFKKLLQYTGLKDKNGKEIYEGDIIDCDMSYEGGSLPHGGVIVYNKTFAGFATKNEGGETLMHKHILSSLKIIGNIHENPELLKNETKSN